MTSVGRSLLRCLSITRRPSISDNLPLAGSRSLEAWKSCATEGIRHYHRQFGYYRTSCILETSLVGRHRLSTKTAEIADVGVATSSTDIAPRTMSPKEETAVESISPATSVLRYTRGEERFQLKIVLRNGKVFNFDRAANDPLQACMDRMMTNISKKVKTFKGEIAFILGSKNSTTSTFQVEGSTVVEDLLGDLLMDPNKFLQIQIGEEIYDVAINPPEIFSIKFFKQVDAEFPLIPLKLESSSNFKMESSRFFWEFANAESLKTKAAPSKSNRKRKDSGGQVEVRNESKPEESPWKSANCNSFIFTPPKELVDHKLRLTCIPSNGMAFGLPFTVEVPTSVTSSVVQNPLFEERLQRMSPKPKEDLSFFRVVSYNCLADTYATEEWFIASPKGCLSPDFRLPYINKEIAAYNADLYCLQEIDEKFFEGFFSPYLEHKLKCKGYFSCKTGNTKEGIATFYNPEKFDSLRSETIVILEHMKTLPFWNAISSHSEEFLNRLNERNTVFQLSILKPKGIADSIVIVANTHLYFHPDADHIRCLQTLTCVDYIEKTLKEIQKAFPTFKVSVLFCGDFNCTPPFSSYRFLTSGKIEEDDFDWTSHSTEKILPGIRREHKLNLKNSHPGEELTNITTCFEGCLDYILYQPEYFELLSVYPPPTKAKIATIAGIEDETKVSLPNFHTPSDHLPLISDFRLKSS